MVMAFFVTINAASNARTPPGPPNPVEVYAYGSVTALTHADQLNTIIGKADFSAPRQGDIAPDTYLSQGMRLHGANGGIPMPLANILPGIVTSGNMYLPDYRVPRADFPGPILGGGTQSGLVGSGNLAATFTQTVTQFGATFSLWPNFFSISAWKSDGSLIGEVGIRVTSGWPKTSFLGIDTGSTPIALLIIGNDSPYLGHVVAPSGGLALYDDVVWATIPEPGALVLALCSTVSLAFCRLIISR